MRKHHGFFLVKYEELFKIKAVFINTKIYIQNGVLLGKYICLHYFVNINLRFCPHLMGDEYSTTSLFLYWDMLLVSYRSDQWKDIYRETKFFFPSKVFVNIKNILYLPMENCCWTHFFVVKEGYFCKSKSTIEGGASVVLVPQSSQYLT